MQQKREKALTEIEARRINYSSVAYSVITVGVLKLLKVITKYSMDYTKQYIYCITGSLSLKLLITKMLMINFTYMVPN